MDVIVQDSLDNGIDYAPEPKEPNLDWINNMDDSNW